MRFLFIPAAAVALVSQLAVLWAVIAGRAPGSTRTLANRWGEIAWVVLPTLVLVAVLVATWNLVHSIETVGAVSGVSA